MDTGKMEKKLQEKAEKSKDAGITAMVIFIFFAMPYLMKGNLLILYLGVPLMGYIFAVDNILNKK